MAVDVSRDAPVFEPTEADWLGQVLDAAEFLGWARAHFRPARTEHGWRTAVQGDGKGFPDLILIRPPRLIVAELKARHGRLSHDQQMWLSWFETVPCVEVYVWRPADLPEVLHVLRRPA